MEFLDGQLHIGGDWQEVSFNVPWGVVTGKWWGSRNKQPMLALHGWQDNAGTFDKLCPYLINNTPIFCVDLPGHGFSSPYPTGMHYTLFWDGVTLIRRLVKLNNWKNIVLMGHSLGGALSFLYASCFPDDVDKLISFDMAGPTVRDHNKTASKSGYCIDKFLDYENLPEQKIPCYTYNEMVDVVLDGYAGSINEDCAKILLKRGMTPAPKYLNKNGFYFTRDLRLKVSLLGMFSFEQVISYAERIKCKVLNIRADPGLKLENPDVYNQVIEAIRKNSELVVYKIVPGTHHLHLVEPAAIEKDVNDFLQI